MKKKKAVKLLPKKHMTYKGVSIIHDPKEKKYFLVDLRYEPESKQAYVKDISYLTDWMPRVNMKLHELIARNEIINVRSKKDDEHSAGSTAGTGDEQDVTE